MLFALVRAHSLASRERISLHAHPSKAPSLEYYFLELRPPQKMD